MRDRTGGVQVGYTPGAVVLTVWVTVSAGEVLHMAPEVARSLALELLEAAKIVEAERGQGSP